MQDLMVFIAIRFSLKTVIPWRAEAGYLSDFWGSVFEYQGVKPVRFDRGFIIAELYISGATLAGFW